MNALQNVAVLAARRAGNVLIRYMNKIDKLNVEKKGHNDFVSEADRAAEAAGIKPIVGADVRMRNPDEPDHVSRLTLLCKNRTG